MKIFVPSLKDANPYLDEILNYTKNEFVFDDFRNFKTEFEIVNIQWPESLFGWEEPTENQLIQLEEEIKKWKKFSKLVYTYHDERTHFGVTPNYSKLFELIETNADAFIHLGEFSKSKMKAKYPVAIHFVLFHPLYLNSFKEENKMQARLKMNIDQNSLVIIAPGRIRNIQERNMLLKAFKALPEKNKVLISNNMLPFIIKKDFRGRVRLKRFFDVNKFLSRRMRNKYLPPKYIFNYSFTHLEEFSLMLSAADVVFIPRINLLNSGNVFLGLSYGKVIVGPGIGNIREVLLEFNLPIFNPSSSKSIKAALNEGVKMFKTGELDFPEDVIYKYHPKNIARNMDNFFEKLKGWN